MVESELQYYDQFNTRSQKYVKLQKCDIELFSMMMFIEREDIKTCLYYYDKNHLQVKGIRNLFREKKTGKKVETMLGRVLQGMRRLK